MGGGPDLDAWLEKIRGCEVLAEDELKLLCEFVRVRTCLYRVPRKSLCKFPFATLFTR